MAEHHGIKTAGVADAAFGKVVQIGSANADRFYGNLNLAWRWIWRGGTVGELKLTRAGEFGD